MAVPSCDDLALFQSSVVPKSEAGYNSSIVECQAASFGLR